MIRRSFIALGMMLAIGVTPVTAAPGFVDYKPGLIKKALASGKTVFVDYAASWCSTCRAQERVIAGLLSKNKAYKSAMLFVRVDWDQYGSAEVSTSRNIPRRSTLILLKEIMN